MEVIAAVVIGALLWLIGPGRKFWSMAAAGTVGEREARRTLHSSLAAAREPLRVTASPRPPPQRASRLSVAPLTAEPAPPPAAETRAPTPPLPLPTNTNPARAAPAPPPPLRRTPITLGVALLLQVLAFIALGALIALAYARLEHKAREDAEATERRLTVQLSAFDSALAHSQQALAAIEAAAAAQTRALERIEARIESSAPKVRSEPKPAPTKAAH